MKLIIFIFTLMLVSCVNESTSFPEVVDTAMVQPPPVADTPTVKKIRIWSSLETNLPRGTVENGEKNNDNNTINWLSIRDDFGKMSIVKNIDPDLWEAIHTGDIIK